MCFFVDKDNQNCILFDNGDFRDDQGRDFQIRHRIQTTLSQVTWRYPSYVKGKDLKYLVGIQ